MRKTFKFDLSGNFITEYNSMKETCMENNISMSQLYNGIRSGKRVGPYVYTHDMSYYGTIYTAKKGRPKAMQEDLFSVEQACEILKVSKFKVYELIKEETIKGIKIEGIWYIEGGSLFKYVKKGG